MHKIPEKWREAAMAFALDIARDNENFPKKVLSLFDKYFGIRRSIFFPGAVPFPGSTHRRKGTVSSYITYGIRYGPMHDYKERVYQHDIFRYVNLPGRLKGKRVLFTDDVMPFEDYERTHYGIHMSGEDMYYQAVLFFYTGDWVIGSMGLAIGYSVVMGWIFKYAFMAINGNLFAILTADISLELLAEQVNSIKTYPNSFNLMIGQGGTFLVHRDKEYILNKTLFEMALYYDDSLTLKAAHDMVDGKRGMVEYDYGEERFLFYAPIRAAGWSVAVSCMHSDIFAKIDDMRAKVMTVAIPGLLLLVILCYLLIRYTMRPLNEFAHSAMEIARGTFSAKLPHHNNSYEIYPHSNPPLPEVEV